MLVQTIMTMPVVTIHPDDTLADAITLMDYHRLSGLAVVDHQGRLCGILSEGDLLRRIEFGSATKSDHWWSGFFGSDGLAEAYKKANGRKVSDVMSEGPITIGIDGSLAEAATLMETHHVKRLPVEKDGKLVGILSRSDFVRALGRFVTPSYEEQATSDGEIQERVKAEIANQKWAMDCRIRVDVEGGRVKLSGYAPSDEHKSAAEVAAENVVGVVAVEDVIKMIPNLPVYAM
jgi:CBS domain-containing protein